MLAEKGLEDRDQIAAYAREPMGQLYAAGLIQGDDLGNVNPWGALTRAEGAAVLVRVQDYLRENPPGPRLEPAPTPEDAPEGAPEGEEAPATEKTPAIEETTEPEESPDPEDRGQSTERSPAEVPKKEELL